MAERVFIESGSCKVWISIDEGRLMLSGQDLGGFMGTSEYEYFITVEPEYFDNIRMALGAAEGTDIVDVMCANAEAIFAQGETTWLESIGVPFEMSNWHHFDD
ncbi:MAG: hypothetical protein ACRDJT_06385 [Actinomycetota bacterium]